ncbi:MAG: hypothetical protein ACXWEY_03855 [Bacteroidia bacterium]
MTFKEIYNRIIPYWGNTIVFYDGKITQSENSEGFNSYTLSSLWDEIEKEIGDNNVYEMLMVWTMY